MMGADVERRPNYLTIRLLYPKPEHRDDILAAIRKVSEAAHKFNGLVDVGAWLDKENDRIVNVSLWESRDDAEKARTSMHSAFADIPWNSWERRSAENLLDLTRVI